MFFRFPVLAAAAVAIFAAAGGAPAAMPMLASDEGAGRGRRRRVVLTPQWLASSLAEQFAGRRCQKNPDHKSTEEAVNTIAQGRPGQLGEPVVTTLMCFFISHARPRARRAPGFPCALVIEARTDHASPGRFRAAGMRRCG